MNNKKFIEASLSRIWSDYQEIEFGIITAGRIGGGDTDGIFSALTSDIKKAGYGFVRIDGFGQVQIDGALEQKNQPFLLVKNVKTDDGPLVDSGAFETFMLELVEKNRQCTVVLQNLKSGTKIYSLMNENGDSIPPKLVEKTKKFNPSNMTQFISKILGDSFILEGFKYGHPVQNWIQGMALEQKG